MSYFSGQGKIYAASRNTDGSAGVFRWLGNAPAFSVTAAQEKTDHKESFSGIRAIDKTIVTQQSVSVAATLEDFSNKNLALLLGGKVDIVAAATSINESVTLVLGDVFGMKNINVVNVVVVDSAGTPATLVDGIDYKLNPGAGSIEIIDDVSAYTAPFSITYDHSGYENVKLLDTATTTLYLRFEGLNTVTNKQSVVEVYKVEVDASGTVDLIGDALGQLALTGSALIDNTKTKAGIFGQFARVMTVGDSL